MLRSRAAARTGRAAAGPRYPRRVPRVVVDVVLKPEISDPQGQAVLGALGRLGHDGVRSVRQGKHFVLEVEGTPDEAELTQIAETLLANPVIEDVELHLPRGLSTVRIGVLTFPGSLDDVDAARAVRLAGGEPVALWHADHDLKDVDAVVLPGGFSYGDYLRAGAIAARAPLMQDVVDRARAGPAGAGHLQRLPGALRGRPAARAR